MRLLGFRRFCLCINPQEFLQIKQKTYSSLLVSWFLKPAEIEISPKAPCKVIEREHWNLSNWDSGHVESLVEDSEKWLNMSWFQLQLDLLEFVVICSWLLLGDLPISISWINWETGFLWVVTNVTTKVAMLTRRFFSKFILNY